MPTSTLLLVRLRKFIEIAVYQRCRRIKCYLAQNDMWRTIVSIAFGFALFALLRYFHFESIVSLLAGGGLAILTFFAAGLEPLKKALEIEKLWRERRKDAQETQEKRNLVRPATAGDLTRTVDEMKKFGSYRERKILYRAVNDQERLDARPFIADSSDEDGDDR